MKEIDRGPALRELSGLMRSGMPIRKAIASWPALRPGAEEIAGFARRVSLGQVPTSAARSAIPTWGLAPALWLHESTGAVLPELVDALADWSDEAGSISNRATAATAGATLSARVVGALPLFGLAFVPASRAPVFDRTGIAVLVLGALLMVAGMCWMSRLVPRASSSPDLAVSIAVLVAAAVKGGCPLGKALETAAEVHPEPALRRAAARVSLGQPWPDALRALDDEGLSRLADVVEIALLSGAPVAASLSRWARSRSRLLETQLSGALSRAPVRMVVPLTVCVLPAFGLMTIVPFLRGLATT